MERCRCPQPYSVGIYSIAEGKLRVKYYSDFKSFKDAIDSIIDGTDNIFKDQVAKLIGEKIQLYDNLVLHFWYRALSNTICIFLPGYSAATVFSI